MSTVVQTSSGPVAEAQVSAGGRVWLSRFDHAPSLPPFDVVGPSHGADNACLWARPPRFVERPLIQRPGADMTAVDLAVTEALQASVPTMVTAGHPGDRGARRLGVVRRRRAGDGLFDAVTRVQCDPSAERRRAWAELAAPLPR